MECLPCPNTIVAVLLRSLSTFFIVLGAVLAGLHIYFAGQPKPAELLDAVVDVVKSSMGFAKAFSGGCADEIPSVSPQGDQKEEKESEKAESLSDDEIDELPESAPVAEEDEEEDEESEEEED